MDGDDDLTDANMAESMAYLDMSEHDDGFAVRQDSSPLNQSVGSSSFEYSDVCAAGGVHPQSRMQRMPTERIKNKVALSRSRYRRRRYDILTQLLLSSADLLMLERSQAKAFLPMLSKLLVPQPKSEARNPLPSPLWRGMSNTKQPPGQAAPAEDGYMTAEGSFKSRKAVDSLHEQMDHIDHLAPFLESLSPGAGVRCLSLFLLQHLLSNEEGYDARVRHAVKTLGVAVLIHDMQSDPVDVVASSAAHRSKALSFDELVALASRKFESLEHCIASKLLRLSQVQQELEQQANAGRRGRSKNLSRQQQGLSREQIMRGFKIGGTAVVAGTLFAVTGGLAAPGIAAGVAAIAGSTAATAAAAALLTSTAAVTTIFGVGGGGLAAYKMQRRTQGLTEFEFRKETGGRSQKEEEKRLSVEAELFSTICLSGWLRDKYDFQRPWGTTPSHPRLTDRLELLERFYSIHSPDHVSKSAKILASWKGEEEELWSVLRQKYGRDPDHLFPLNDGPRLRGSLTHEQQEIVDKLFVELGHVPPATEAANQATSFEKMRVGWKNRFKQSSKAQSNLVAPVPASIEARRSLRDSLHGPYLNGVGFGNDTSSVVSSGFESVSTGVSMHSEGRDDTQENSERPDHLSTVWDYQSSYGGELYSVQWESHLLTELCDSVSDLAYDVVSGGTAQILRHTALSTLMSAIAWPYALVNAANMIDGTWTLAVERADEAGRELARSLMFSRAGNRPVTLVGFSFGARAIYSCLKELSRYQEKWEDYQESTGAQPHSSRRGAPKVVENERSDDFYRCTREPASIVEDAIIMGLPNHLSLTSWKVCRQVVAGRLVNCYSRKDLILSLMFQFKRLGIKPVCGTCPVNVPGVENIDVSDLISGHQDYTVVAGHVLKRVRHGQPFRSDSTTVFIPHNEGTHGDGNAE